MAPPPRTAAAAAVPARRLLLLLAATGAPAAGVFVSKLTPYGDNSIRVQVAAPGNAVADAPIMALVSPAPPTSTSVSGDGVTALTNGNLAVTVDAATGLATATRVSDGRVLLKQTGLAFGAPNVAVSKPGMVSAQVDFGGVVPGEKIYGLGEHRNGAVQMAPWRQRFADSNDYSVSAGGDSAIPWYASSAGYGFVWNSPAYGYVSLDAQAITWYANATGGADFWLTTTPANFTAASGVSPYAPLLRQYVDAVGHAPPMPFFLTGFVQSKDRYRNQSQLLDVARGYVTRGLPCSVLVIDWYHWKNQGDWTFNPACWPDPQGMVDELHELGIEPMVTFWPFQTTGSANWANWSTASDPYYLLRTAEGGALVDYDNGQYLVDQTSATVRSAVFDKFWEGYGRYGIHNVWLDASEPEHFGRANEGNWSLSAGTDGEVMEGWVQQHVRAFAEGMASKGLSPSDFFLLPRHAWAGTWRHSAALWSGDIQGTFPELALQIRVLQTTMMSGVALWTSDIGGYRGTGNASDPVYADLIVRWFQFGAFCPLFRLHGHRNNAGNEPANECGPTNGDNEVWTLTNDQVHYDAIATMMRLREQLREYVAAINAETAATGMPMVRPMFLQWPLDAGCAGPDVEDQFMFGPDWLVAPVYTFGATSRSVYLPALDANHSWVHYFNESAVFAGGARVTVPVTISDFPLFVLRKAIPVPPPTLVNATSFYSAARNDTVLCVGPDCFNCNAPGQPGDYVALRAAEAVSVLAAPSGVVVVDGTPYALAPLNLFYSAAHSDNFVSTAGKPDDSYSVYFANGYVLTAQAPGTVPLQVWFKQFEGANWDYATVASAEGLQWVQARGYTLNATAGYVFPAAAATAALGPA